MTVVFAADGQEHPARGVLGGRNGNKGESWRIAADGVETRLPNIGQFEFAPGERLRGLDTAGGGYGDPLERGPARVLDDVLEGYVSPAHAGDVYGVIFTGTVEDETLAVDAQATAARRAALRKK
jgi:N-methylhydantoinase B